LTCANAAADTCSDAEILACNTVLSDNLCLLTCKGGPKADGTGACNVTPEGFEDEAACQAACEGYTTAQRWIARFCVSQFQCDEPGTGVCFPPPTENAPGAAESCAAAYSLCGEIPEFGLPKDPEICGWIITGTAQGPKLGLEGAAECIEQFGVCPDTPNLIYGCFSPEHEPCNEYCAKLKSCGAPASEFLCTQQCKLGNVYNPDATATIIECVMAGQCNELAACFQGGGGQ